MCLQLKQKIAQTENKALTTDYEIQLKERVNSLLHVYHTVAVHYADLHDTPERMLEKGCINEIVTWRESRKWFFWRLKRLILEDRLVKQILTAQGNLQFEEAKSMLNRWFLEDKGATEVKLYLYFKLALLIFINLIFFLFSIMFGGNKIEKW